MDTSKLLTTAGVAVVAGAVGIFLGKAMAGGGKRQQRATPTAPVSPSFAGAFPLYCQQFLDHLKKDFDLSEQMLTRVEEMLKYTCIGGKGYRGGLVSSSTKSLCEQLGLDFKDYQEKAYVVGWCIEILQGMFLVADDIMDCSKTRRGQPCWYLLPTIQMDAVNDSFILESFLYFLLKKYFGGSEEQTIYLELMNLFHNVSLQTEVGQMLDLVSQPQGRPAKLEDFSEDLHTKIVTYKTAYYTFYLPIASALIMMGCGTKENFEITEKICVQIGIKFQIQDDYLDCYGKPEMIGKVGTDIQDHKCSWLCVKALKLMSPQQRSHFELHYGKDNEASIAEIKKIFIDLDLEALYLKNEEESKQKIVAMIESLPPTVPKDLFLPILNKIHLRKK